MKQQTKYQICIEDETNEKRRLMNVKSIIIDEG